MMLSWLSTPYLQGNVYPINQCVSGVEIAGQKLGLRHYPAILNLLYIPSANSLGILQIDLVFMSRARSKLLMAAVAFACLVLHANAQANPELLDKLKGISFRCPISSSGRIQ